MPPRSLAASSPSACRRRSSAVEVKFINSLIRLAFPFRWRNSGATINTSQFSLYYEGTAVVRAGVDAGVSEEDMAKILNKDEFKIELDLGAGTSEYTAWTSFIHDPQTEGRVFDSLAEARGPLCMYYVCT